MNTINMNTFKGIVKSFAVNNPKATLLVEGDTGIGKTRVPIEVANELKIPIQILHPALEAEEDIGGIPDTGLSTVLTSLCEIIGSKDKGEDIISALHKATDSEFLGFKMPAWWKTIQRSERGILLIDEPNRAPEQVLQALFSLIEVGKRTLRDRQLGEGWLVVLAINPPNGFYQVRELAPAFKRRTVRFRVSFDLESWIEWGRDNNIHELILGMGRATPEAIWVDPNKCEDEISPTPASWTEVNDWINSGVIDLKRVNTLETRTILSGKIGERPALLFQKYVAEKYTRPITAKEIFEGSSKKVLEKFFEQQEAGKNDRMHTSIEDIISYLKAVDEKGNIPTGITDTLKKLILDKRFQSVYRSALMVGIVKQHSMDKVIHAISTDNQVMNILEEEVETNLEKGNQ